VKGREDRRGTPADGRPPDIAVAQIVALARAANVHLDMVDGKLVIRSSDLDWTLWPGLRRILAEVGVEAIARYFESTTTEDRVRLAAIPPPPGPRAIGHRFSMI
jgi:hypothetical protein